MSAVQPASPPTASEFAGITVGEVMHQGIVGCSPDASLRSAARLMAHRRVHCLVVHGIANGPRGTEKLMWGLLTDHDILRAARADSIVELRAGGVAAADVVTIGADESLDDAVRLMLDLGTTHLVVVSPNDQRPIGVLSSLDVARSLAI